MMRNKNYDAIKQKVIKQKKREQTVGWREREMFVDKNRYTSRGSKLWALYSRVGRFWVLSKIRLFVVPLGAK